jgi:hypothetical protein
MDYNINIVYCDHEDKESFMTTHYVYGLVRPDTNQIFYIGVGKDGRAFVHQKLRKKGRSYKDNIICKMIDELGYPEIPVVFIAKDITRSEACDLERDWISRLGRYPYGSLTNVTAGGDGLHDPTPETLAKISLARKGKPLWPNGRKDPRSDEGRKIWAEKITGRVFYTDGTVTKKFRPGEEPQGWIRGRAGIVSEETRAKMRAARIGWKPSEEHKQKVGLAHKGKKRDHFDSSWWSSPEGKAHLSKVWINDGQTETKVSPDSTLPKGWKKGRLSGKFGGHNKGKPMSQEARAYLSKINKGKSISEGTKAKIASSLSGRSRPPEVRQKISAGHLARSSN